MRSLPHPTRTTTTKPIGPAAARMRRHRQRARSGTVLVRFEAAPTGIERLVEWG